MYLWTFWPCDVMFTQIHTACFVLIGLLCCWSLRWNPESCLAVHVPHFCWPGRCQHAAGSSPQLVWQREETAAMEDSGKNTTLFGCEWQTEPEPQNSIIAGKLFLYTLINHSTSSLSLLFSLNRLRLSRISTSGHTQVVQCYNTAFMH